MKLAMQGSNRLSLALLLAGLLSLGGCASNKVAMTPDEFQAAFSQSSLKVDGLVDRGNQEEAVRLLAELAKQNPGRKEPWVRIARVQFDAANYSQAIVAAEEALQRDTSDRTAKSIRAVSGLRVAAQSLSELRTDVELKGNARSDAVSLAQVMRDTLGEEVLVPPAELEARKKREAALKARQQREQRERAVLQAQNAKRPGNESGQGGGADPFSALK